MNISDKAKRLILMGGLMASAVMVMPGNVQAQTICSGTNNVNCTGDGSSTPHTATIGTGPNDSITNFVTVDNNSRVSTGNAPAISVGNGTNITINGTVENSATGTPGLYGTGGNTIEARSNTTITVGATGKVSSHGAQQQSEAINVHGFNNTITNYGTIEAEHNAAIWFQDSWDADMAKNPGSYTCTDAGCRNTVDNYGTIKTGKGSQANVIGSQAPKARKAALFSLTAPTPL